jgi:hypothetical protein
LQALFLCDDDETLPDPEDQEEQEEVEVPVSNAASVTVDARSILSSCSGDVSLGFEDQTVSDDTETIKIQLKSRENKWGSYRVRSSVK